MKMYSERYIEEILQCLRKRPNIPHYAASVKKLRANIINSEHWKLSDDVVDLIQSTDFPKENISILRLPYDSITVEFNYPLDKDSDDRIPQVIHAYYDKHDNLHIYLFTDPSMTSGRAQGKRLKWDIPPHVQIDNIAFQEPEKAFVYTPTTSSSEGSLAVHSKYMGLSCDPNLIPEKMLSSLMSMLIGAFGFLMMFSAILTCRNISKGTVDTNKDIVRKRKLRQQFTVKSYRTIHVEPMERFSYQKSRARSHSVTPHLRRGHIRNQPTKLGVVQKWIKPVYVGGIPDNKTVNIVEV